MITIQSIEEKLAGLKQQRDQLIANTNAVSGAIQLCEQLVQEFNASPVVDGQVIVSKD